MLLFFFFCSEIGNRPEKRNIYFACIKTEHLRSQVTRQRGRVKVKVAGPVCPPMHTHILYRDAAHWQIIYYADYRPCRRPYVE